MTLMAISPTIDTPPISQNKGRRKLIRRPWCVLKLNSGAEGDLDFHGSAAVGRERDDVAGDLLAVDDERLHALRCAFRIRDLDAVGDAHDSDSLRT